MDVGSEEEVGSTSEAGSIGVPDEASPMGSGAPDKVIGRLEGGGSGSDCGRSSRYRNGS